MKVVTLATLATLPQARVLAASLGRHQPSWELDVVLVGVDDGRIAAAEGETPLRLRSASEELDLDAERLIARHDAEELSVLLVPRLLQVYARRTAGPVLHLPPSAWVLADLEPIEAALGHGVLLTPRVSSELPEDGLRPSRRDLDRAGRMSPVAMAVDGGPRGQEFLDWWARRVEGMLGSLDGRRSGARPEDRPWLARYLELAPARFAAGVLEDPGCNVSMWNLHLRPLTSTDSHALVDGRWPLRLLDLPGFEPDRPHRLSPWATRVRVSRSAVLRELCTRYAGELQHAGWRDADRRRDVGRTLDGGLVYDDSMRALYARALALGERFGELFSDAGTRAFLSWLAAPAPEGGGHGITRYVFYRVARERPDVMRAYPELDGADGREYVNWCWAFGRDELAIPDRFMPPRHSGDAAPPPAPSNQRPERDAGRAREAAAAPATAPSRLAAGGSNADPAVRVSGYLGRSLGLGAAARAYVCALRAAGVPVTTASVPLHHLERPAGVTDDYGHHGFEDLVHHGAHGFEVIAVNADELPDFVERLGEGFFVGPRIGIWGWETNSIPARWRRAFALIDEIWVYSHFMAENIGAAAPVPVVKLPPPVTPPPDSTAPLRLGVPDGFLFLFVFDYLSTIQRKNPVGLVEAFKRAFAPGEGPQLLIKTINAPLRPLADEEVLWAAHGRPDIHVVDRSLSADELHGVMAACDCYASLHRAEGFGLTLAEAMAIGKPVIATGYSGNVDFMNSDNSFLVDYAMRRVGPECEIYPPEGEWAEPSVEHAAELMRLVCEDPSRAARVAQRAREDVARVLSPQATGAAMRSRLEELSAPPR